MIKLVLPKRHHIGLKIYCNKCKIDNPKCKHYDQQIYRVRIHVPGSDKKVKVKVLKARDYSDAVIEAVEFEKQLIANNFSKMEQVVDQGNDYSIIDAFIKYNQYLNGQSNFAHLKKNISTNYKKEIIRYCTYFNDSLKKNKDITRDRIKDVNGVDISNFYRLAEKRYAGKTFNKCMSNIKSFFDFLIEEEDIEMKNPLRKYVAKPVLKNKIEIVNRDEFFAILDAVDTFNPFVVLGGKGERKNMYKSYIKDGFRLFLLTGGRREEVVDLRWNDIFIAPSGVKFFRIRNIKVERITNKTCIYKHIPINDDLYSLLLELGYNEKKGTNGYILYPERDVTSMTIMNSLSKAFTHYRKGAGIQKEISLKNLRKTYLTWVNQVMNKDTRILSSHSNDGILKDHYLDPTVLTAIEKGALKIKIFG